MPHGVGCSSSALKAGFAKLISVLVVLYFVWVLWMCDTLVALGNSTEDGSVVFGKNSDRAPNEAQVLRYFPHAEHPEGAVVRCTYIDVPQVHETYEVVLSSPYWIWGAEMGVNEHGVAIGNEAVWSKEPYRKTGLLGMDLLRLALERADSARKALQVIVEMIEKYGQGGSANRDFELLYHNSFIIADTREAWVLETADRFWVAEKVRDVRSISNGYTIRDRWDLASPGLVEHAVEMGWCESRKDFDFARCYGDAQMDAITMCSERLARSTELLKENKGNITVELMMSFLRDHGGEGWDPWSQTTATICMHASPSVVSNTAGSYVGHLMAEEQVHWFSPSSPCLSLYIPVFMGGVGVPEEAGKGEGVFSADSPWWIHEKFVRTVHMKGYSRLAGLVKAELDVLQKKFLEDAYSAREKCFGLPADERRRLLREATERCFKTAYKKYEEWGRRVSEEVAGKPPEKYYEYWSLQNYAANISIQPL
ncbi:MAG: C69 family dipeptidase [Candidatus Jordarchaeales archaeon]|nr:C69 family dipeptidase [Candidatus Jordarchaeia archaeon]